MATKKLTSSTPSLYGRVRHILDAARDGIARTVNSTQAVANWLIGREIVEDEQLGQRRAGYGAKVLADLSKRLTSDYGRGYSVDNLEAFRQFYLDYPHLISETASRDLALPGISETLSRKFEATQLVDHSNWKPGTLSTGLSWSHYRCLLRVGRKEARDFYEIEALQNAWSVRELSRQIASLLFDRLAKSRDKVGLLQLAMKPEDISQAKNKDLPASLIAIQRAAQTAREIAVRTGTDIFIQRGQQIVRITADELRQMGVK